MLTDNRRWYVYCLSDPRTDAIFYVGKGSGRRAWCHTATPYSGLRSAKHDRIAELERLGTPYIVTVLAHFQREHEAYQAERELIARLPRLTNISHGQNAESLRTRLLRTVDESIAKIRPYRECAISLAARGLPTSHWWNSMRWWVSMRREILAMPDE